MTKATYSTAHLPGVHKDDLNDRENHTATGPVAEMVKQGRCVGRRTGKRDIVYRIGLLSTEIYTAMWLVVMLR